MASLKNKEKKQTQNQKKPKKLLTSKTSQLEEEIYEVYASADIRSSRVRSRRRILTDRCTALQTHPDSYTPQHKESYFK